MSRCIPPRFNYHPMLHWSMQCKQGFTGSGKQSALVSRHIPPRFNYHRMSRPVSIVQNRVSTIRAQAMTGNLYIPTSVQMRC